MFVTDNLLFSYAAANWEATENLQVLLRLDWNLPGIEAWWRLICARHVGL